VGNGGWGSAAFGFNNEVRNSNIQSVTKRCTGAIVMHDAIAAPCRMGGKFVQGEKEESPDHVFGDGDIGVDPCPPISFL
jgi:hypothetical protein